MYNHLHIFIYLYDMQTVIKSSAHNLLSSASGIQNYREENFGDQPPSQVALSPVMFDELC